MKKLIQHDEYGEIVYEESDWTGRKSIFINGYPLQRDSKTTFLLIRDGEPVTFKVKGNYLRGVSLEVNGESIEIIKARKWYEIMFALLPVIVVIIWGSSPELCSIIPMIGGVIGAIISVSIGYLGLHLSSKCDKWYLKLLIGIVSFVFAVGLCIVLGYGIISALQ